jgi:hypothetical protein
MTATEHFVDRVQEYYGMEYSYGMGKIVVQYLDAQRPEVMPYLLATVLKTHSASFRALPDVAIIEAVLSDSWQEYLDANPREKYGRIAGPDAALATDEEIEAFNQEMKARYPKFRGVSRD